ncbi:unnamed protein product [Cuscuta epithymum]|uniref:AMP-dependent synthetase/ligase domain-containing protein n=2 Tax=Cuscuta epithymum TaxID=186058 RepID=A0AAV0BWV6_9ASTE|nr:unnamed protein product [Cuscuta epithymum]
MNIKALPCHVSIFYDRNRPFQDILPRPGPVKVNLHQRTPPGSTSLKFRVLCDLTVRKCSPVLESTLLSRNELLQSSELITVPDIWKAAADKFGDRVALVDPYHDPPTKLSYRQLEKEILSFAEGLRVVGLKPDEKIALFAENSCRWLVADQGIMTTGAIDVVRGSRSSTEELLQIYNHSESVALVVDNHEMYSRIAKTFHSLAKARFVILLWGEMSSITSDGIDGLPIYSYSEIIDSGNESHLSLMHSEEGKQYVYEPINSHDVATLIYTSGTTGNPKGVMLTHNNLLHQVLNFWDCVPVVPGDRFLSVLPPWHAYERACEYSALAFGTEQVYTTVRHLKAYLKSYQPNYLVSVPLIYETLYSGIMKQINASGRYRKLIALIFLKISYAYKEFKNIYKGKCLTQDQKPPSFLVSALDWLLARSIAALLCPLHIFAKKLFYTKICSNIGISKAGISGGGSLPIHVDKFFEAIDITVQNGYGLTEASPVVACRWPNSNVIGSIGFPLAYTEIKVVDVETDEVLPHGSKGLVKVKGPQVMKGYYKNPMATKQAIDENGWLNTGDLGWIVPHHSVGRSRSASGVIVLEGRAKDTIVLSSGENVEPSEIEEAAMCSNMIEQIVVIGQDKRRLGAIVVPNKEEVLSAAKKLSVIGSDAIEVNKEKIASLLHEELRKWTTGCTFQVGPLLVIDEPFTVENGLLTPTMKVKRDKVADLYKEQIDSLYI